MDMIPMPTCAISWSVYQRNGPAWLPSFCLIVGRLDSAVSSLYGYNRNHHQIPAATASHTATTNTIPQAVRGLASPRCIQSSALTRHSASSLWGSNRMASQIRAGNSSTSSTYPRTGMKSDQVDGAERVGHNKRGNHLGKQGRCWIFACEQQRHAIAFNTASPPAKVLENGH